MKAIICLIAIFAIASARVNPLEVYQSFSAKLGLTQEVQAGVQECAVEIRNAALPLLAGGKAASQARLLKFLFAGDAKHTEVLTALLQKVQTSLPACQQVLVSLAQIFAKATVSADEQHVSRQALTPYRFNKYSAEILSILVNINDEAKYTGNSQKVGEHLATIVQLLSGLSHPESIVDYVQNYQKNHEDHVEIAILEPERFIQTVLNTAAKQLGLTAEVSEERVKELKEAVVGLIVIFHNAQTKIHQTTSVIEREVVALGALRDLVKAGAVVAEQLKLTVETFTPIFGKTVTPRKLRYAALAFAKNYLRNLPTIQRRSVDFALEVKSHHAVAAGKALAAIIRAY